MLSEYYVNVEDIGTVGSGLCSWLEGKRYAKIIEELANPHSFVIDLLNFKVSRENHV